MCISVISFSHFLQRTSEVVEVFGCLLEFSDVLVSSSRSQHWQDYHKILTPLTQKRLTGIKQYLSVQSKCGMISKLVPSIFVAKLLTVCSVEDHLTSLVYGRYMTRLPFLSKMITIVWYPTTQTHADQRTHTQPWKKIYVCCILLLSLTNLSVSRNSRTSFGRFSANVDSSVSKYASRA